MRVEEFRPLMVRVEAWWPATKWDDAMIAVWCEELQRFPVEQVRLAFERLKREHTIAFAPAIGAVLAALERPPENELSFDEALLLIRKAIMREADNVLALELLPMRVRAFASQQGMGRLRMLPLDDPEYGELKRKELREAWERYLEVSDGREIAAIASGGEPRQLDPLSALQLESSTGRQQ